MRDCTLRATFKAGQYLVLHWIKLAGNTQVHSYYLGKDQLAFQDKRFNKRTSLFKDQLYKGNSSLLLRKVEIPDQGRYKCYTSTINGIQESFIDLNVDGMKTKYTHTHKCR